MSDTECKSAAIVVAVGTSNAPDSMEPIIVADPAIDHTVKLSDKLADVARTRVHSCMKDIAESSWELGKMLFVLWRNERHVKRWGFASWERWVREELDLDLRKAQYLRGIYEFFAVKNELDPETQANVRLVAWTKARELVDKIPAEGIRASVAYAKEHTRQQVREMVKQRLWDLDHPVSAPTETFHRKTFSLAHTAGDNASQLSIVEQAMSRASQIAGSDKEGHLLVLVCSEFLATNDFSSVASESRARFLAKYERGLGLRLVAVDPATGEVVYGISTLERLAEDA